MRQKVKAMVEKLKKIEDEEKRQQFGFTPYLAPTFKFQMEYDNFQEILAKPAQPRPQQEQSNERGGFRGRGGRGGFQRGGGRGGYNKGNNFQGAADSDGFTIRKNASRGGLDK